MSYSSGVGGDNFSVSARVYLFLICGIFALGAVLYWRTQLFLASEYVEMPLRGLEQTKDLSINKEK